MGVTLSILLVAGRVQAQFEEGFSSVQLGSVSCSQTLPSTASVVTYTSQGEATQKITNVLRLKLNELATTSGSGSPLQYYPSAFTATANITVNLWAGTSGYSGSPTTTETETLTINYDPTPGNKYTPISYLVLSGTTTYGQVSVTVNSVTVTGLTGSWTASNVLPLLTVESEMQILRFFTMSGTASNLTPTFGTPVYDPTNHPDQYSVSWTFPDSANNNFSQLEYAWVENETQGYYFVNGTFSANTLFQENSTRIDIDDSSSIFKYNIPLLYDANPATGGGILYYRVRAVQRKNDGSMIAGPWSTPLTYANNGHEPNLNWQVSTDFAENAKSKTVIQYYDGTLRPRQTVTKDNSTGNTTVAETIYDLQGRPNVQILPTPTMGTAIQYYSNFNKFVDQATYDNPARYFDLALPGTQCSSSPALDTTTGNGLYYSGGNPWIGIEKTANFVPNAKGYAYTETRYTDDPTQRVSVQGGAGQAYQVGNLHTTNYFYGQPAQNELDALFGTEAGYASHYFKNMVEDANGQMSITYVDMHGRTVATALAGGYPNGMVNINNNTAFYPVASGLLTDSMLTQASNIITGDSIQSTSTILVPTNTWYHFYYSLNPATLKEINCNQQQICFDCKYNLEISIRQEGCSNAAPIVLDYNNLQIVPANEACNTPMGFIGTGITTPTTQIIDSILLTPGSWVVRKTLSINDSVLQVREDSALSAFLCKTQQYLADSVLTALTAATSCNVPSATRNCSACQAALGNYTTFKANYIASLGGITPADSVIHALFSQDSLDCAEACGTSLSPEMTTLGQLRAQMINDMIPYSGQYALPTDSISSDTILQAKYNIFETSYTGSYGLFGSKPFYQHPVSEPNGAASFYMNSDGTADNTIYPGGVSTNLSELDTITDAPFTEIFNRDWANQLLWYHPEYQKLLFAQTTMQSSYSWLDQVNQCTTYATALANGYTAPLTSDPYFTYNSDQGYVPSDRTKMSGYLTGSLNSNNPSALSIWQLANGIALTDTSQPLAIRQSLTATMSKTGIDPSAVTAAQKNAVWQAFRSTYLGYRNDMVVNYINYEENSSLSSTAMAELQLEGKQLRFVTDSGAAVQNGATWWNTATNTTSVDSVGLINLTNTFIANNYSVDQCTAERVFWQGRLEECEALQQYLLNQDHGDSVLVNTIVDAILDSMVMVCHLSINASNPAGATNVNPVYLPVVPANFENIINHVFYQYGIDTITNFYFCNPYTIDYPKPFNSNPPLLVTYKASVDTCNCQQYAGLKSAASAAGFDTTSRTSMNSYLLANYNDTLSLPLWQGLQQCNSINWNTDTVCYLEQTLRNGKNGVDTIYVDSCVIKPIPLGALSEIPAFLSCGYVKPCVSCSMIVALTDSFRVLFPAYAGVPYTGGSTSVDTGMAKQNDLWARYLNYKTGFSLTANAYATAYLNCQDSGVANLVLTNRSTQPPAGSAAPALYTASSTVSFEQEYTSQSGDEFETDISASGAVGSNGLCYLNPPVTYITLPDTTVNGCQSVQDQANFIAQMLFQQLQDSLISNFDSLYRAKCFSAQSAEIFYATYQPSEYHYTLYYYDQAGNLLKTLPPDAVQPNYSSTYFAQVAAARAAGVDMTNGTNNEGLATQYRYNTLNQVIAQQTPDAGLSQFWYDRLGRLAVSQNALQAGGPSYSYTLYDALGRITEVGQKPQTTAMTQTISQDTTSLANWLAAGSATVQITRTIYDLPYLYFGANPLMSGVNLRNRVAYTMVIDVNNTNSPPYRAATFYSYDPHGNVDTLLQDYGPNSIMGTAGNRFKFTAYNYDLISGKVNQVSYQPHLADAFYHQYSYDAENRITNVRTSTDSIEWQNDASYTYYRHGPLARVQLGDLQLQGIDYAYTVQGWLKSINPSWITPTGSTDQFDSDGVSNPALFERDAYKLNLNYFDDGTYTDFTPVNPLTGYEQGNALPSASKRNLYNGNIGSMAINIRQLAASSSRTDAGPMLYNYEYDQLNRISSMDAWAANGSLQPINTSPLQDYAERYTYDPNGNILTLNRNGDSTGVAMDQLSYKYIYAKTGSGNGEYVPGQAPTSGVAHLTNQLSSIQDAVTGNSYTADIKSQAAFNYSYDAIGELTGDAQQEITNVTWNVYGKILSLSDSGNTISFTYDAAGNRISKTAHGITTWYVRDAQGNVMSVYTQGNSAINSGALTQTEAHLYGSSRLGLLDLSVNCGTSLAQPTLRSLLRGSKLFELTNHLGNVLETISDKKVQHTSDNSTVDYYLADVLNANDYYSFGMQMPVRSFNAATAANYRYGFNGKEDDDEVKGAGNQQDYGMRIYDPRVARFLSVDPIGKKYPYFTPYQFTGNMPIVAVDQDGMEMAPNGFGGSTFLGLWAESDLADRARQGDQEAAKNLRILQHAQMTIAKADFLLVSAALTGSALSLGEATSLRVVLTNMAKLGTTGLVVNGTISLAKGEKGYELIKSSVSGFLSGAMLGLPWAKSIEGVLAAGALSGSIGEFTNQVFDNAFGIDNGYNLKEIMQAGDIGAVANMVGDQIVNSIDREIDEQVAKSLSAENSPSNLKVVRKLMKQLYPRAGNNQIKKLAKEWVEDNDGLIKKDGEVKKAALNQAIQRSIDILQDKANSQAKDAEKEKDDQNN